MTDKTLVKQRFSRAAQTYDSSAAPQRKIASVMAGLLSQCDPATEGRILEIGCGTGFLTLELRQRLNPRFLAVNDLCSQMLMMLPDVGADLKIEGDAETIAYPDRLDLIASCSTVQWFDNLSGFFDKCALSLAPKGLLAVSSFGQSNLPEIARLTSRSLRYYSTEEISAMLEKRFEIMHMSQNCFTVTFPSPMQVLHHLKQTGVTGTARYSWTRSALAEFDRRYRAEFAADGGVKLTYNPIYFIARKK